MLNPKPRPYLLRCSYGSSRQQCARGHHGEEGCCAREADLGRAQARGAVPDCRTPNGTGAAVCFGLCCWMQLAVLLGLIHTCLVSSIPNLILRPGCFSAAAPSLLYPACLSCASLCVLAPRFYARTPQAGVDASAQWAGAGSGKKKSLFALDFERRRNAAAAAGATSGAGGTSQPAGNGPDTITTGE